jgi:hypothetical protein
MNSAIEMLVKGKGSDYSIGKLQEKQTNTTLVQLTSKIPTENMSLDDLKSGIEHLVQNGSIYRVTLQTESQTKTTETETESQTKTTETETETHETKTVSIELVCRSTPRTIELNDSLKGLPFQTPDACYDGHQIRLWWNKVTGRWNLSTTRRINAYNSKWSSDRSFGKLFHETASIDYSSLKQDCDYTFVMIHPDAPVVMQPTERKLIHISTFSRTANEEVEEEVTTVSGVSVEKPEKFPEVTDWDQLESFAEGQDQLRGLIVRVPMETEKQAEKGTVVLRVRCDRMDYSVRASIRGNTKSLIERYLQIRKESPELMYKFLEYYPDIHEESRKFEQNLVSLRDYIYNLYVGVYIRKSIHFKTFDRKFQRSLKDLHLSYVARRKTGVESGHRSLKTTPEEVWNYLNGLSSNVLLALTC